MPSPEQNNVVQRSRGRRGPVPKPYPAGFSSPTKLARAMGISRQRAGMLLQPPNKQRARDAVRRALDRGELVRPRSCESCQEAKKLQAHHDDYERPLNVRWLCSKCHTQIHPHPKRKIN